MRDAKKNRYLLALFVERGLMVNILAQQSLYIFVNGCLQTIRFEETLNILLIYQLNRISNK